MAVLKAEEMGSRFLVRTCVDRLAEDGDTTISRVMKSVDVKGIHKIEVEDQDGKKDSAIIEIKYERILVRPPIGKQDAYPELELTVIHAKEKSKPQRRERIKWKLMTNLPVIRWRRRWKKLDGTPFGGKSRHFTKS